MEETREEKQNRKERLFLIIILIIITIFVIIYLLISYFGRIEHKPKIPTGNVDIFEIIFGGNCVNSCKCNNCNNSNICCDYCKNNCSCYSQNTESGIGNKVTVYDGDTEYSSNTPLNIFTQTAYYVVEDKIAPTSENTYQFVIRNRNDFNIRYSLKAEETNIYNINMKYRLKRNGYYVVGNDNKYVTADEIEQYNIQLADNTYDVYTLDWKWFEGSNDTEIGEDISSYYKLNLEVTANQE